MGLPSRIEIVPPSRSVMAQVTIPGSKSITNRALVLAALSSGEVELRGALWSEDTQVMVDCLLRLDFQISVEPDSAEASNRTIRIKGNNGKLPSRADSSTNVELFVSNAGTAARFLAAMVCLGEGPYRLSGTPRMHERPQEELFNALRQLGYRVDTHNNRLPATIYGAGPSGSSCTVSAAQSSQFASALLLCKGAGQWNVEIAGHNPDEEPYIKMTTEMLEAFPKNGGVFQIEPDASSGSYFQAARFLQGDRDLEIAHWPQTTWQVDSKFPNFLPLPEKLSRATDLGDSIMTAIVVAPFSEHAVKFTDLGRLRLQECERVQALRNELSKCGAMVMEMKDTLQIYPSNLHGAEIETYDDHRMAMCFAVVGLKVPGIILKNPSCVKKTFPNFFHKLAAPAPHGLGITILDRSGPTPKPLALDNLIAE